jgi:maleylpyruvate isomerase
VSGPEVVIARVSKAHVGLLERVDGLSNVTTRRPSRLPDWTVGHLLTHLARNADSHVRRTEAAIAGVVVDQYPGGVAGRASEIEAGASRSAEEITRDLSESVARLDAVWREVPDDAWSGISRDVGGRERRLWDLPARRWQEVEVHLVDLDIGVSHRDWSDEFVASLLPVIREGMQARLPDGQPLPRLDDARDELAWLYGRLRRDDLPALPPWG